MNTKEELVISCEKFFEKSHPSWGDIKEIIDNIINEYPGNWGKEECSVELTPETSDIFYNSPGEYLLCTQRAISMIFSISVTSITISGKTLSFKVEE